MRPYLTPLLLISYIKIILSWHDRTNTPFPINMLPCLLIRKGPERENSLSKIDQVTQLRKNKRQTFIPEWMSSKILSNVKPFDTERMAKIFRTETFFLFISMRRTQTNILNIVSKFQVHNFNYTSFHIKCVCLSNIYQNIVIMIKII